MTKLASLFLMFGFAGCKYISACALIVMIADHYRDIHSYTGEHYALMALLIFGFYKLENIFYDQLKIAFSTEEG
jgi:hypothetical protein